MMTIYMIIGEVYCLWMLRPNGAFTYAVLEQRRISPSSNAIAMCACVLVTTIMITFWPVALLYHAITGK